MKKTIVVNLKNKKSIDDAVNKLRSLKKNYPQMQREFMEFVCQWIIEQANRYIDNSDIGASIKSDIQSKWEYVVNPDFSAKITNNAEKAVFVEFGVGVVGQMQPHPMANQDGYDYNRPSIYKYAGKHHDENTWRFTKYSTAEVDLPTGSYEQYPMASGALKIITTGAKGTWYAYNAVVDAKTDLMNPNGQLATEWNRILERYMI